MKDVKDTAIDYSRYFWQGDKVQLRPLRIEDAEQTGYFAADTDLFPKLTHHSLGQRLPNFDEPARQRPEPVVSTHSSHAPVTLYWTRKECNLLRRHHCRLTAETVKSVARRTTIRHNVYAPARPDPAGFDRNFASVVAHLSETSPIFEPRSASTT